MVKPAVLRAAKKSNARSISSEIVEMTASLAQRWRVEKHFERQRPLSPGNTARLAVEMRAGRFLPGTQIYLCVLPDGSEYIVNGNHTLEAIIASGLSQILDVIRLEVSDIDEAGMIYSAFDQHKKRTLGDSMRAHGIDIQFSAKSRLGAALSFILQGFEHDKWRSIPHASIIRLLEDYKVAAETFQRLRLGGTSECTRILQRAPVMAIALETLRYQPSLAEDFWHGVAHDDGLKEGMPERALLHFFRNSKFSQSRGYWARAAILAWNAKFRGESCQMLKVDFFKNVMILGTPHDKGLKKLSWDKTGVIGR